jgi:hypothetical protein
MVLPESWRQHIARHGTVAVLVVLRRWGLRIADHACPPVDNTASTGVYRRAGFRLIGDLSSEYQPVHHIRVNDGPFDLR